MLEHTVLLKLKEGVTEAQIQALLDGLEALKPSIPRMLGVSGGYNNSPEGKNAGFTYGFVVRFRDAAARDTYVSHPRHIELARTLVRPLVEDVLVFDYEH